MTLGEQVSFSVSGKTFCVKKITVHGQFCFSIRKRDMVESTKNNENSVGVQGGKRSMKSKSKPLCCYFHSAYVSVRVVQVPKRGLDLSLLDSPTSTADNSVIFKADD